MIKNNIKLFGEYRKGDLVPQCIIPSRNIFCTFETDVIVFNEKDNIYHIYPKQYLQNGDKLMYLHNVNNIGFISDLYCLIDYKKICLYHYPYDSSGAVVFSIVDNYIKEAKNLRDIVCYHEIDNKFTKSIGNHYKLSDNITKEINEPTGYWERMREYNYQLLY